LANLATADLVLLGGGLELAEQEGTFNVGNLAGGATPFAVGELVPPTHTIAHLNDPAYGNDFSWIGAPDTAPIAGISLGAAKTTDHHSGELKKARAERRGLESLATCCWSAEHGGRLVGLPATSPDQQSYYSQAEQIDEGRGLRHTLGGDVNGVDQHGI